MKNRLNSIVIVCFLITSGFLGFITFEPIVVNAAKVWYVGSGLGNDTTMISTAIDLANPGDIVFVYSGVYLDQLYINKTINIIGEDRETTIIDGGGMGKIVQILSTDWVNITGFTITNGGNGIWLDESSNNTFINNIIRDHKMIGGGNGHGFFSSGTPYSNNKIIGNIVYNNEGDGIHLEDQSSVNGVTFSNNSIINNTVYNNTNDGIHLTIGTSNYIVGNIVYNNGLGSINPRGGIQLTHTSNNNVVGNTVYNNDNGIILAHSGLNTPLINNTIAENVVNNNDNAGIRLWGAIENTFVDNSVFDNNYSVYMERQSFENNFINCTLSNASTDDFYLTEDSHAILLNTTFNKTRVFYGDTFSSLIVNWFMHVSVIYWNGTPVSYAQTWVNDTLGTNIINGPTNSEGWIKWIVVTEYMEWDTDGDNIGDRFYFTPYNVTATDGVLWGYADPNMNISKVVQIILGIPTSLLPPKNLTTKIVNFGNNVELEWEPPPSVTLDHYLIYRANSATNFDFSVPYNLSTSWPDPKNTTWIDPDPTVTSVDDDFYYIVRAANFDESDISSTSNTAGVWTKTFEPGISTFSLPLEPFVKKDTEFYCQDMNASYIKWMNLTIHTWMQHDKGDSQNNTLIEVGEGYEIGFLGKSIQTRYTFTGLPGAMIIYDDDVLFSGFDPANEAKNLTASVDVSGNITLTWQESQNMNPGDWYEIYYSNTRTGFFGTLGIDYDLACPSLGYGTNTTTITGLGASNPGARLYFMVVPFNSMVVRGASTYSIGIWTEEYFAGYDTFGIPLKLNTYQTADWYCDNIPDTVGINYFINNQQRWSWHSTQMPEGAFDPVLEMAEGYQISTSGPTKFIFIGV